jgi:hypothetical protein
MYIWGPPGIGKSAVVKQVSLEVFGREPIDLRLAQCDPTDLRGVLYIKQNTNGMTASWVHPACLPDVGKHGERGVLFLDELNLAVIAVQHAAYQLILDRRIGDYYLPVGWLIIAAGNREEDKAYVYTLPAPLANRFIHIELEPDLDCWIEWAWQNDVDLNIIAFLRFRPNLLYQPPQDGQRAFPTPRSWQYVDENFKVFKNDQRLLEEMIRGCIGEGATHEFLEFVKVRPQAEKLLKDILAEKFIKIKEAHLQFAVNACMLDRYKSNKRLGELICKYAVFLPNEYAASLITDALSINQEALINSLAFSKVRSKLSFIFDFER